MRTYKKVGLILILGVILSLVLYFVGVFYRMIFLGSLGVIIGGFSWIALIIWFFVIATKRDKEWKKKHPEEYKRYKERKIELEHKKRIAYEEERARIRARNEED